MASIKIGNGNKLFPRLGCFKLDEIVKTRQDMNEVFKEVCQNISLLYDYYKRVGKHKT